MNKNITLNFTAEEARMLLIAVAIYEETRDNEKKAIKAGDLRVKLSQQIASELQA